MLLCRYFLQVQQSKFIDPTLPLVTIVIHYQPLKKLSSYAIMDTPRKYLIKNLHSKPAPISVWLQGTIEQAVNSEILIISDGTGRAKITKCESADGVIDKSSLRKGIYCCIIGTTVNTKGLPEVQASKFLDLSARPQMINFWEAEVTEADLFLQGKLIPLI